MIPILLTSSLAKARWVWSQILISFWVALAGYPGLVPLCCLPPVDRQTDMGKGRGRKKEKKGKDQIKWNACDLRKEEGKKCESSNREATTNGSSCLPTQNITSETILNLTKHGPSSQPLLQSRHDLAQELVAHGSGSSGTLERQKKRDREDEMSE